jgi:GTP-binding protein EngB required for normal cell division
VAEGPTPTTIAGALDRAIEAAARCGLDVAAARAVRQDIEERAGYPGDLYVLALAGGTGVGKSSLLNALSGTTVSEAGPIRPTTGSPVAWVPADRLSDAGPLLAWLGGAELRPRDPQGAEPVAIVDLPDLDSMDPAHAARVDAVLPRIDAVVWVVDPEKYADAVLHDRFLRRWMPRLARQAIALNKTDRVHPADVERLRDDLADRLRAEGLPEVPILTTSALADVEPLRRWLAEGTSARRVVREQLAASARAAAEDLARAAGLDASAPPTPLVTEAARRDAVDTATRELMRVVDPAGLERQAVAATRLAAAPSGGGLVGTMRALVERGTGIAERHADPEGHLRRWRERGALFAAVRPIRDLVAGSLSAVPPASRPGLAAIADVATIEARLAAALDRAVASPAGRFETPASRTWLVIGIARLVALAALLLGVVWIVASWAGIRAEASASVDVAILGPVPVPVVLVAGGAAAWWLLGRALALDTARLGRRWARTLASSVRAEVDVAVPDAALRPLEGYEAARRELWDAARDTLGAVALGSDGRPASGGPGATPEAPARPAA